MTLKERIIYLFKCYSPNRMLWDYNFGKCSNIPLCCRLFFITIWPWYCITGTNEKYIATSSDAEYVECWHCRYFQKTYNRLKYCERCKKRKKCLIYADIEKMKF